MKCWATHDVLVVLFIFFLNDSFFQDRLASLCSLEWPKQDLKKKKLTYSFELGIVGYVSLLRLGICRA